MSNQEARRETKKEASAAGRPKYLGDSKCRGCGGRLRYTMGGGCVACAKAKQKKRYALIKAMWEAQKG